MGMNIWQSTQKPTYIYKQFFKKPKQEQTRFYLCTQKD